MCPFCKVECKNLKYHLTVSCRIRQHYDIYDKGNSNCKHEILEISFFTTFKNNEEIRPKLTIKCKNKDCNLHIIFDTFEKVWLPYINLIK